MEKIEAFQATRLRLSGFSSFAREVELPFSKTTLICGKNFEGKTSLQEAVAYAITGRTLYGGLKIDELLCEQNPNISIELELAEGNGGKHTLRRIRDRDTTQLTWDGNPIRQKDLNLLFGEPELFLSLYNPLYFTEVLGTEGHAMLERLLPCVDRETVLAAMTETDRALLRDESLLMPDYYMKTKREEIARIDRELAETKGKLELLSAQKAETEKKIQDVSAQMDAASGELHSLVRKKDDGIDYDGLFAKQKRLKETYEALLQARPELPNTAEIDGALQAAEAAIQALQNQAYQSAYEEEARELSKQLELAVQRYRQTGGRLKALRPNIRCPICRTVITGENIDSVRAGFQSELAEIRKNGTELQARHNELLEKETAEKRAFEEKKAKGLAALAAQRETLSKQREQLLSQARQRAEQSSRSIQSIREELVLVERSIKAGNLMDSELERGRELTELQAGLDARLRELRAYAFDAQRRQYEERLRELEQERKQAGELITAAAALWHTQSEIQMKSLKTANLEIKLHEIVKTTGEYKNVFKLTYKGRAFRLSCSERLRAGLEFVCLLQRLTDRCYPVAIDEADNMTDLPRPSGQVLMTRFVRELPLSVKLDGRKELIPIRMGQDGKGAAA